ncbi:glucose-signaling factor 2 [Trichomonascus vanleenenianus]|uniref:Gsf2p n=1 Tax=Trichomonascus vanleenenianus TaxID=2268995 RepID=UPI003ECA9C15
MSEPKTMDIYIRMNEDCEKDYCFSVDREQPISSLSKIFETLPMVLSPSYFYNPQPIGFAVSTHPGFLTSEGALLFSSVAHNEKWLKKVDQSTKIKDACWEGQLVVPLWEYNYTRFATVLSILGGWLYLDFPEYLHPTPGYAPTTLFFNLVESFFPALKDDTPSAFNGIWWQWGFFTMHLLKVGFIYLILHVGGVNPVSFNPIVNRRSVKKEISREILLDIGWTSARRATPMEWREEHRKKVIEQHGGIVAAYHAKALEGLGSAGVWLREGEGFNTDPKATGVDESKFTVNEEYFQQLYVGLAKELSKEDTKEEDKALLIRNFRRSGPYEGPEGLKQRYEERKKLEKPEEKNQR